ncbi:LytTR family DNA-binding domain-containing protein [Pedobacter sp. KBS0701]|uniref:LytR/AlgR family response regulator transcription factor n=1 Tax=Pedobacter sp. KBS0701 TaxID=2578106 RepID=UPI00143DCAE2|nr:LytTR family DNA-binding domain-containing protein [Pedobacter sp. KBS0701]
MYTCLAIDDESSAIEIITDYVAALPQFKLLKSYSIAETALKEIENLKKPVDVIFMDIEMPNMNGLELAKLIKHKTNKLVFTTAHSTYAINAYELEADAFLLKPFSQAKFDQIVKKLFSPSANTQTNKTEDFVLLKSTEQRNRFIKIKLDKIYAVEAQERVIKVHLEQETILSNSSFADALVLLHPEKGFSQVHRSFIIAENQIKTLERSYIILNNGIRISIGRKYLDFYHKMSKKKKNLA